MADDTSGSYGKRPLWQWVLIYLIIGGILYGLVYYFFLGGSSSTPSLYTPPATVTPTEVSASPTSVLEQVSPAP